MNILNDIDKIYVLHCVEYKDRYVHIENELHKILTDVEYNKVEYINTCHKTAFNEHTRIPGLTTVYYDKIYHSINPNVYDNVFDCLYMHYNMIKTSYLMGYENIMILEDDCKFNVDKQKFDYLLNNIPKDADIVNFVYNRKNLKGIDDLYCAEYLYDKYNFVRSTMFRIYSRQGMLAYINSLESKINLADWINQNIDTTKTNIYVNNYNVISSYTGDSTITNDIFLEEYHD